MNQLLSLGVIFISGLSIGSGQECCQRKDVGIYVYNFVRSEDTSGFGCTSGCVYTRDGAPGSIYCFKRGNQESVCQDDLDAQDFLYISPTEIYELPSFRLTTQCNVIQYPIEELQWANAGLISGSLIICGGYANVDVSSCYKLTDGAWVKIESLVAPTSSAAISQAPGGLLITGGWNGVEHTSLTQAYSADGWKSGPDLPIGVRGHCQIYVGQEVIVVGGATGWQLSERTARVFSLQGDNWTELPAMNTPRAGHTCAYYNSEIWVIGGEDSALVEIFNMGSKQWRYGPDLPMNITLGEAVVYKEKLFAIDSDGPVYHFSNNGWEKVANIKSYKGGRHIHPAPVMNFEKLC